MDASKVSMNKKSSIRNSLENKRYEGKKTNILLSLFALLRLNTLSSFIKGLFVDKTDYSVKKSGKDSSALKEHISNEKFMESSLQAAPAQQKQVEISEIEFSSSIVWLNFANYPKENYLKKGLHFCINYVKADEQEIVKWVKKCRAELSLQKKTLTGITVFVRFNELNPGEVPRLTKIFGDAGATVRDYSKFADNFQEAVEFFNAELENRKKRVRIYRNKRNQVAQSSVNF